jgi:hypothetical protein
VNKAPQVLKDRKVNRVSKAPQVPKVLRVSKVNKDPQALKVPKVSREIPVAALSKLKLSTAICGLPTLTIPKIL